jgi:aspartyl-tRNA(Asn)/glutamyl-tRNA(Gln) amidotransferase subunit C
VAIITRQEVEHVALLARLAFEPDEIERFTSQLNDILGHVARLDDLDTSQVAPTASVVAGLSTPLREDEPWVGLLREEVLAGAPASERGFYRVPRVLE